MVRPRHIQCGPVGHVGDGHRGSFLLSSCQSQCFYNSCVIITWKCWQLTPSPPPTNNCFHPSSSCSVKSNKKTNRKTLRHHLREHDRRVASDLCLWFRTWLCREDQIHNLPTTGSLLPTREQGLETLCNFVSLLLQELLDGLSDS